MARELEEILADEFRAPIFTFDVEAAIRLLADEIAALKPPAVKTDETAAPADPAPADVKA